MPLGTKHDLLNNLDSDSDDEDYVPPDKLDSDSEPSEAEDTNTGIGVTPETTVDDETVKRTREALWTNFQASVANPSKPSGAEAPTKKMVKVERRYRFAGDEVVEVVEVPDDSPEARKWPLWKDPIAEEQANIATTHPPSALPTSASKSPSPMTGAEDVAKSDAGTPSSSNPALTVSTWKLASGEKPVAKRPGPRKPKTSLAPLPGPAKAKKLTTLDKSAMDWKSHLQAEHEAGSSIKDDLDANRRAGGYLEKVEFLKRVEVRKEENLDALKSNKRRKL